MGFTGQAMYSLKFQALALFVSFTACASAAIFVRIVTLWSRSADRGHAYDGPAEGERICSICRGHWGPDFHSTDIRLFSSICANRKRRLFPNGVFNDTTLHYGAHSFAEHVLKSVGFAYAVLVNGLPAGLWLLALVAFIRTGTKTSPVTNHSPAAHVLILFALSLPLAFGLLQIPVGNRYLNIGFMLLTICFCLLAARELSARKWYVRAAGIGVICIVIVAEVYPFRPLYLAFRPFWSDYPDATKPVLGKFSPSMSGWGEELMLASELFETDESLGKDCNKVRIYFNYPGEWLSLSAKRERFTTVYYGDSTPLSFTHCDYYLFSRTGAIQGQQFLRGFAQFPACVVPDARLNVRGYDTAWLYRGDRLIGIPLK